MNRFRVFGVLVFAILFILMIRYFGSWENTAEYEFRGTTMGTVSYSVKVLSSEATDLKAAIDSILVAFNQSQSTYIPDSEISKLNKFDTLSYESDLFYPILEKTAQVVKKTDGAFDPTIGPLVNAWGFGPGRTPIELDSGRVDSLLEFVGFDKVRFDKQKATKVPGVYVDMSAIAKGYAVDLVGVYLEDMGYENYLVEIGGEVRARGKNTKGVLWSIGVDDPLVAQEERKILAIVELEDRSLATSGNYRNYYEKDGKTVAHIIDPRTGYNNFQSILSASVFAPDCMTADAYATAFMVMGVEASAALTEEIEALEAILIYEKDGQLNSYISPGIRNAVKMNQAQTDGKD